MTRAGIGMALALTAAHRLARMDVSSAGPDVLGMAIQTMCNAASATRRRFVEAQAQIAARGICCYADAADVGPHPMLTRQQRRKAERRAAKSGGAR